MKRGRPPKARPTSHTAIAVGKDGRLRFVTRAGPRPKRRRGRPAGAAIITLKSELRHVAAQHARILSIARATLRALGTIERDDVRDFILLMHYTGLRLGEARALDVVHVDLDAGHFVVADPKNGKPVQLPIVRQVEPILRRRIKAVKAGPLFPFGDVRKSHANVDVTPWSYHDLRRQYVTAEHRCGIDDLIARRLTNHASPDDDAHAGYVILNADALRQSAQAVADWLDARGKARRR